MKKIFFATFLVLLFISGCIIMFGLMVDNNFWCLVADNSKQNAVQKVFCSIARQKTDAANTASLNCLNKGGEIIVNTNKNGERYSICRLAGNAECELQAYLNGNCVPGTSLEYQKKSEEVAREWMINNSPTYIFDGLNLSLKKTNTLKCVYCYEFYYTFLSRNSGYGDRLNKTMDKKTTDHETVVTVENGKIISVVTDKKFDEMATVENEEKSKSEEIFSKAKSIELYNDKKISIGQAKMAFYKNKTYCQIILPKIEELAKLKKVGWLIKDSDTGQFFPLGVFSFDINSQNYVLNIIIDGDKTDYRKVVITNQSEDKIVRPETRLAEGVFSPSLDLLVD